MTTKRQQYRYDLVFDGKLRNGFTPEEVARRLKEEVNLKDETITMLFARKAKVCKNADYETVLKWHKKFFSAGIDLKLQIQPKNTQKSKIKNRQIRTMAKVKALPLSSANSHDVQHKKNTDKQLNKGLTLDLLRSLFNREDIRVKHSTHFSSFAFAVALMLLVAVVYFSFVSGLLGLMLWSIFDIKAYFGPDVSWLTSVLIYLLPIVVVAPLFASLLTPLFSRSKNHPPQKLESEQHELLYGMVELLCDKLDLAPPDQICVNNDVDIRLTFSVKQGNEKCSDRSLIIGMPIIAGMTVEQLVAALAFELNFSGRGFQAFVCYQLKQFDAWLYQLLWPDARQKKSLSNEKGIYYKIFLPILTFYQSTIFRGLRYFYSPYRKLVSWVLKPIVLQSLENASKLVGKSKLEQSLFELKKLRYSGEEIQILGQALIRSKRFLDNIPLAIANFYFQYRVPIERKINEDKVEGHVEYLHFSDQFIESLTEQEKGFFQCTSSGKALITHFEFFCSLLTSQYYKDKGIDYSDTGYISDASMLAAGSTSNNTKKALDSFFNGLFIEKRILSMSATSNELVYSYEHQMIIDRIRWKTLEFKAAMHESDKIRTKINLAKLGQSYLRARVNIVADAYFLKGYDSKSTIATISLYESKLQKITKTLDEMDALLKRRIELCNNQMVGLDKRNTSIHLRTLELMTQFSPVLNKAEQNILLLDSLLKCTFKESKEKLTDTIRFHLHNVKSDIETIVALSMDVRRVEGVEATQSLNDYLKTKLGNEIDQPLDIDAQQAVLYARLLMRSTFQWYASILAEVAERCEFVEKQQAIKPLKLMG